MESEQKAHLRAEDELRAWLSTCPRGQADESFWSNATSFARLAESGLVERLVRSDLTRVALNDGWLPRRPISESEYALVANSAFDLRLRVAAPSSASSPLATPPSHQMLAVIGLGFVDIRQYRLPPPLELDVLDRNRRLEVLGVRRMEARYVVELRAAEDLYEIVDASTNAALLVMTSPPVHRFQWYFDRSTLAPCAIASSDRAASRLESACRLVAALGGPQSGQELDGVASLALHPDHFVRWAAIGSILQRDPTAGTRLLERALSDSHPHVREAARRTLCRDGSGGEKPCL